MTKLTERHRNKIKERLHATVATALFKRGFASDDSGRGIRFTRSAGFW